MHETVNTYNACVQQKRHVKYFYVFERYQKDKTPVYGSRVVTVAYQFLPSGDIIYGASHWVKTTEKEFFFKKRHRATALGRLQTNPVWIKMAPENVVLRQKRQDVIRRAIRYLGVRGRKRL